MFREKAINGYWLLALIISWGISNHSIAVDNPQLTLGDKVSVFSDKAYRKNNGRYFEAVGNVVIISEKDTVYGEVASLNQDTMMVKVEGNVRFITQDMTLYGSHIEYNITTGSALVRNARILSPQFNLVANELVRISESEYVAKEAEFSTCKDCAESWSIYGKQIRLKVNDYVQIKHGLAKVKGVNVIYIPYIILPILDKRQTGLLIPRISSRAGEGLSMEQPFFWAIDESKDMTIAPTFWAKRGYGGDLQYRQRFNDLSWFEFNSRSLDDTIYEPGKTNISESGERFFRYFTEVETHQQWTPNFGSHMRFTGARDLDIVRDTPQFTDPKILGSDIGFSGNLHYRRDYFSLGAESYYLRNQLVDDALEFDRSYAQVMPRVTLSSIPVTVFQSQKPLLQRIALGLDSSYTRFRQVDEDDEVYLRNADRFSLQPYLMWHFFTWGPLSLKGRYTFDQQSYIFADHREPQAGKNAALLQTEISFTMDKIFGLAYEETIPLKYISQEDLKKLRDREEQGLKPIQKTKKKSRLVGDLPEFESGLSKDSIVQVRNSYRHSQTFSLIHHYIPSQNEYGNKRFLNQINGNQAGWWDYEDAIRSQEYLFGPTSSRTTIPPENTLELQWKNTLIRKSPKRFSFLEDEKYLRDNFRYSRVGYFNVSQGYLLNNEDVDDARERLTRLWIQAGYNMPNWSFAVDEFYFHQNNENFLNLRLTRRFESFNIFARYNQNNFENSQLNTVSFGGQVRPTDVLGFALVKDIDLEADRDIRTIYSVDIMPNNDCWILNINHRESLVDKRTSFNIMFNFGDEHFERYRNDYFAARRL